MEHKTINNLSELGKNINFETKYPDPKRGEIYMIDLNDVALGTVHIMQKSRPAMIIQNDVGNRYSTTILVALITSKTSKEYPMQYKVNFSGIESTICFEQILTLDKNRLLNKMGELTYEQELEADEKLMFSLGLNKFSLSNVEDINVVSMSNVKTREGKFVTFGIEIIFSNDIKKEIVIKLEKLKEFNKNIDEDIDFDELKRLLDCCKGLNWLVNNNEIE